MPIMQEMNKDPEERTRFNFVVIPQSKAPKTGWAEDEALVLAQVNTYWLDWDGGMRMSGWWEDVRASMQHEFTEYVDPDADKLDDNPQTFVVPSRTSEHAVAMVGPLASVKKPSTVNLHPREYVWSLTAREGTFNYDAETRKPKPLTAMNVRALAQAFENQANNVDIGTDKAGGHLLLKRYAANVRKFEGFVGRPVRWELRTTDAERA